ncbi:hypothetical protein ACLEPN_06440 [Myxococcus sp. 1LA]
MPHGVLYDESQDAWTATVEVEGALLYEDVYASEEDAALGREIAIVVNSWPANRNYPEMDLPGLCRRVATNLGTLLDDDIWHPWAQRIGLSPKAFLQLGDH